MVAAGRGAKTAAIEAFIRERASAAGYRPIGEVAQGRLSAEGNTAAIA